MFKKNDFIICKPAEEKRNENNKEFEVYARVVQVDDNNVYLDRYQKMGALHCNSGQDAVKISIEDAEYYYQLMTDEEKELFAQTLTGRRRNDENTRIHLGGDRLYGGWEDITPMISDTLSACEEVLKDEQTLDSETLDTADEIDR